MLRLLTLLISCLGLFLGCENASNPSSSPLVTSKTSIALLPASGAPGSLQALSVLTDDTGKKTTIIGSFDSAGTIAEVSGATVSRTDGGKWVFIFSSDGVSGYFYGIGSDGIKEPLVLALDFSTADTLSLQLWDNDWSTQTSVILGSTSLAITDVSPALLSNITGNMRTVARATEETEPAEKTLFEAFKIFMEHKTHFIVGPTLDIIEAIKGFITDPRLPKFTEGFNSTIATLDTIDSQDKTTNFSPATVVKETDAAPLLDEVTEAVTDSSGTSVIEEESAGLVLVSGNNQIGSSETDLTDPIVVRLIDASGAGRPGIELELFTAQGVLQSEITDSDGKASFIWKLSTGLGKKVASIKLKNPAPFKGLVYLPLSAEAIADHDFISFTINSVQFHEDGDPAGIGSETTATYTKISYTLTGTGIVTTNGTTPRINLIFPAVAEGAYSYNASQYLYPSIYVSPFFNMWSLIGMSAFDYCNSYWVNSPSLTITVHSDATKFWGTFTGKIGDGYAFTSEITNGKFMKLK